ncbi:hypothetical protein L3556_00840 [Candidatus Synechococcus calcipolaris G9]|uniref:Uncharacterized protein n=1 Tax=Candidatus Synechococcus calcipolaris G9 TaxID=1497997 RepID=A0ABT6EUC9_9SYNE|nr:hypothetical protein [Candidatus Synechococcus calcipolaris]MDG2989484.1 hypothetical protein [Candidatus Synechococcus calcipolaris G9]
MFSNYQYHTNYGLKVEFDPLLEAIGELPDYFVLQHWQAHPRFYRHFAYFEYKKGVGKYQTLPHGRVIIQAIPQTLQINERIHRTVPTAVLYYPNSVLVKGDNFWRLENA